MLGSLVGSLKDSVSGVFSNYKIVIGIAVLFIAASIYYYYYHIAPKLKPSFVPNQEYKQVGADTQNADLIFFHVTWCPHCKKAMPIWEELVAEHQGKPINGVNVNFVSVDCDKDSAMADRYGIEGFPTIKLIKGDEVIEYDARPNKDTILEFLHSTL